MNNLPITNNYLFKRLDNTHDSFYRYQIESKFIEELTYINLFSHELVDVTIHNIHIENNLGWIKEGMEIIWNGDPFKLVKKKC